MQKPKKFPWIPAIAVGILVLGGACLTTACKKKNEAPAAVPVATPDPNGEGVRPDVRAYIEATYPDSAKTRAALFQDAKVMEKALADAGDKQLSIQHANELSRANNCLWYVRESSDDAVEIGDKLLSAILNTDERITAYLKYDEHLKGGFFEDPIPYDERSTTCDIDPATLPN